MNKALRLLVILFAPCLFLGCVKYGHVTVINESGNSLRKIKVSYPDGSWSFEFGNGKPRSHSGYSGDLVDPPSDAEVSWVDEVDGKTYRQVVPVKKTIPKWFNLAEDDIRFLILTNHSVTTAFLMKDQNDQTPQSLYIYGEAAEAKNQRQMDEQLMKALRAGNFSLAQDSISQGANVNSHWLDSSMTPISSALKNIEALKMLFDHGAVVRWEFPNAAYEGNKEIIELLLANGADINHAEPWEDSALTFAIQGGSLKTVRLLIEKGADVNKPIYNGITPIYAAALFGKHEIASLLIEKGAKVDVQLESHKWTPLDLAKQNQDEKMVEILSNALSNQVNRSGL